VEVAVENLHLTRLFATASSLPYRESRSICSLEKALEDGDGYGSFDILQNIWSRRVAGLDA
jgi:hypothetical protein